MSERQQPTQLQRWMASGALGALSDARVLSVLWLQWGRIKADTWDVYPSVTTLARASGMSVSGVRKALERLERAGAIVRNGKEGTSVRWTLAPCPHEAGKAQRTTRRVNSGPPGNSPHGVSFAPRGGTLNSPHGVSEQLAPRGTADSPHGVPELAPRGGNKPCGNQIEPATAEPDAERLAGGARFDTGASVDGTSSTDWSLTHPDEPEPPPPPDPTEVTDEYIAEVCELMRRALVWVSEPWRPNARIRGPNPKAAGTRKLIRQISQREAATLDDWRHVISAQAIDLCRKPDKIQYLSLPTIGCQWYRRSAAALEPHEYLPWELPPVEFDLGEGESMIGDLPASPGGRVSS